MVKTKNKSRWRSGMGEMLGFAYVVPCIVILVCAILSAAQITMSAQKLTYTAYSTCRAAVVAETSETAKARAEGILSATYGTSFQGIDFLPTTGGLTGVNYAAYMPNADDVYCLVDYIGLHSDWKKGDIIRCTIFQQVVPMMPFTSGVRSQSVVMMIENGSDEVTSK